MTNYHLKEATSNKKLTGLKPQKLVSATTSSCLTSVMQKKDRKAGMQTR